MKQPIGDAPTRSQLLPLQSNWRSLLKKGYFWPGMLTAIAAILLFSYMRSASVWTVDCPCKVPVSMPPHLQVELQLVKVDVPMYLVVLGFYITGVLAYGAYRTIGKATPLWVIPAAAAVTYFLVGGPVLSVAHLLDFGVKNLPENFSLFGVLQATFAAGLPEEALKAIPVFIGVWIARSIQDRNQMLWGARVVEPIDGILIGIASGLGFTLHETFTQYVPQQIVWAHFHLRSDSAADQLLIPRVLQNVAGHAAWAGIFGYYIGLAAMKRGSALRLVLTGLGIAALLHGLWDASGDEPTVTNVLVELVDAVASFAMLAGVIAKARELSPNRSQLIRSQVLDSATPVGRVTPGTPGHVTPRSATGGHGTPVAMARSETWGQRSETWDEPGVECLECGSLRVPLTLGARITESQIPALKASAGDGVVAVVNANPDDTRVLGLKNLSTVSWQVETVGRGSRQLSTGRSIRIERGVCIKIGDTVTTIR